MYVVVFDTAGGQKKSVGTRDVPPSRGVRSHRHWTDREHRSARDTLLPFVQTSHPIVNALLLWDIPIHVAFG